MSRLQIFESVLWESVNPSIDHGKDAFRVGFLVDEGPPRKYFLATVPFVRRMDAEIGLDALHRAGICTPHTFVQMDDGVLRKIMCEALPW